MWRLRSAITYRATRGTLALALGMGLIAGLEGLLAAFGLPTLAMEDMFAGFSGSPSTFVAERDGDAKLFRLNPSKSKYFNQQSFRIPKPQRNFRIVAFGGSTTYGRPYIHRTSFPAWLARLLSELDPGHTYESINLGGISYASYRVRRLAQEAAGYEPDLYVVYSGHNEFLEARTFERIIEEPQTLRRARQLLHHSRLYSALYRGAQWVRGRSAAPLPAGPGEEVKARLEEIGGPELYHRDLEFRAGVVRQYGESIEALVKEARDHGIRLILCTVPSNLSGVSPFKSEHRPDISEVQLAQWNSLFSSASAAAIEGRWDDALALLDRAAALDDSFAALHFARGDMLRRLGRHDEAYAAFLRAKEEDIIPLRALESFNETIREVAKREEVPLADVEARFRAESPNGIPGPSLFVDHVHPTIRGQQLIAWVVLEAATRAGFVPVAETTRASQAARLLGFLAAEYENITPHYRAMGLWGVGRLFHWAGKYEEAYAPLLEAWKTVKDIEEIPRLLGDIEISRDRHREAISFFQEALRIQPSSSQALTGLAKAHIALGEAGAALAVLDRLTADKADSPVTLLLRGEAETLLGHFVKALPLLEEAYRREPSVMRFPFSLARACALSGDDARARAAFAHYLKLAGESWSEKAYADFLAGGSGRQQ